MTRFDEPYTGDDDRVSRLAGGEPLYLILSRIGYDLKCRKHQFTVICRATRQPMEFADAVACWTWLDRTGQLHEYAADREAKRQHEQSKNKAPATTAQGELAL